MRKVLKVKPVQKYNIKLSIVENKAFVMLSSKSLSGYVSINTVSRTVFIFIFVFIFTNTFFAYYVSFVFIKMVVQFNV